MGSVEYINRPKEYYAEINEQIKSISRSLPVGERTKQANAITAHFTPDEKLEHLYYNMTEVIKLEIKYIVFNPRFYAECYYHWDEEVFKDWRGIPIRMDKTSPCTLAVIAN